MSIKLLALPALLLFLVNAVTLFSNEMLVTAGLCIWLPHVLLLAVRGALVNESN
jgi:hypothetical protein